MADFTSFSVFELTSTIRSLLEGDLTLQDVWVTGEVSNMTVASSGHWYFSLKDAKAQLRCVMFRSSAARQLSVPREGDEISVHGRIGVYEARGEYQLYADRVQSVGVGMLYQRYEELKAHLQAEGLFDADRKRPIPGFPRRIGVVTSATAAAFQDILNVLRRRFPLAEVILSPTLVQGNEAPPQIIRAIELLNQRDDIDVMLVCRGGGSIEDLWAFNDEGVARAVAASRIPVVSGVGHEIDFTLTDFAADLRAPTPSAAAEVVTPNIEDLRMQVRQIALYLNQTAEGHIEDAQNALEAANQRLLRLSPEHLVENLRQRVDDQSNRLMNQQRRYFALMHERMAARVAALSAANPDAILARGYAIVTRDEDGQLVKSINDARAGDSVRVRLHDGELQARIEDEG